MSVCGPAIQELVRHIAECPSIFTEEPVQPSGHGGVYVHAVISDLLLDLGGEALSAKEAQLFRYSSRYDVRTERNRLRWALLAAWLFAHPSFRTQSDEERAQLVRQVRDFLSSGLNKLANLVAADSVLNDPDRREELARLGLRAVQRIPEGEGKQEAKDRLNALSSVERERVLTLARVAQERARKVQAELAAKQAAEAAANPYYNE